MIEICASPLARFRLVRCVSPRNLSGVRASWIASKSMASKLPIEPPSIARFAPLKNPSKSYPLTHSSLAKMSEFSGAAAIFFSSSSCLCWQVGAVRTIGHKFGLKVVKTDASFAVICHLRLEKVTLLVVKFSKIIDPFYRVGDIVVAL